MLRDCAHGPERALVHPIIPCLSFIIRHPSAKPSEQGLLARAASWREDAVPARGNMGGTSNEYDADDNEGSLIARALVCQVNGEGYDEIPQ